MRGIVPSLLLAVLLMAVMSCGGKKGQPVVEHRLPDTLTVGTLYSPTGFFILKGDTMGYDYDRICDFARYYHIALRFKVARSMRDLIKMLLYPTGATRRSHLTLSPGFLRSFHEVKYPEDMTLAESYILLPVTVNKCSR
jgi:hypothetical protein